MAVLWSERHENACKVTPITPDNTYSHVLGGHGAHPLALDAVTLRPETAADEDFLYVVYASTRTEELAVVPWTYEQKDAFLRQQYAAQYAHYHNSGYYPNPTFLIVEVGGHAAGRLYVHRSGGEILVVDIALLPAYRGAGIGSALLNDLLAEAGRTGAVVRLHVEPWNRAVRLYERLGFRHTGEEGLYWTMERSPGEAADD